jgi:predicted nucleic acid-binding protein
LIAACALRNGPTVLQRDRDYGLLAHVAPLDVRQAG